MHSSIGRSVQFCSTFFEVPLQAIGCVKRSRAWQFLYNRSMYQQCDRINVIRELLAVKHGYLELHVFSSLVLNGFYSARNARIASAVLATAIPSVRPSVCPSVTRRYCVKTTARSTMQFSPLDRKMCLVL